MSFKHEPTLAEKLLDDAKKIAGSDHIAEDDARRLAFTFIKFIMEFQALVNVAAFVDQRRAIEASAATVQAAPAPKLRDVA